MTKAIVMNTRTGAVTEYDNFAFHAITPAHAGSALGLYGLGGDVDIDQAIVATILTGTTLWSDLNKKYLDAVHFGLKGSGDSELIVTTESTSYNYPLPIRAAGVSRGKPGRGIRENYLAFGYSNIDGADFQLDRIEAPQAPSKTRKV